jgi:hypothetical protein
MKSDSETRKVKKWTPQGKKKDYVTNLFKNPDLDPEQEFSKKPWIRNPN